MAVYFHPSLKILFQHFPCTGGGEFFTALDQLYGPSHLGIYPKDGVEPWPKVEAALTLSSPIHFVSAHTYPVGPPPAHIRVGTFYRDPVERVLSQFFFGRKVAREKGAPESPLPDEKDWPRIGTVGQNTYLKWACRLAGVSDGLGRDDEVSGRTLRMAQAIVERGYYWIGITELFRPSLSLIARRLNWPRLPPSLSPPHLQSGRPKTADLDERLVTWARHVTVFDQVLYEKARARVIRELQEMEGTPST